MRKLPAEGKGITWTGKSQSVQRRKCSGWSAELVWLCCATASSEKVSCLALGSNFAPESYFHFESFQPCDKLQRRGQVRWLGQKMSEGRGHFWQCFCPWWASAMSAHPARLAMQELSSLQQLKQHLISVQTTLIIIKVVSIWFDLNYSQGELRHMKWVI